MSETNYLTDILILVAAAVVAVPISRRLGLGSILGYLAAGAAVGPWGFGFISQVDEIQHIAEFGVVLLLFVIGLQLKPRRLWAMRRAVFGLGGSQVAVTAIILTAIMLALADGWREALFVGLALSLSSTAMVLQVLKETGELERKKAQSHRRRRTDSCPPTRPRGAWPSGPSRPRVSGGRRAARGAAPQGRGLRRAARPHLLFKIHLFSF